jgi:hypothetical protein
MFYKTQTVQDVSIPGRRLCGLTWMDSLLWYSDAALEQILAVDPSRGEVVRRIGCPGVRTGLTRLDRYLLQVVGSARSLRALDPETGETVAEYANPRPGGELCGIEATAAGVWMGYKDPPTLELRSRSEFRLVDCIQVGAEIAGVTATERFVAFADYARSHIHFLDLATKRITITVGVDGNPTGLTWDGCRIWYCDYATVHLRAMELPEPVAAG